MSRLIKSAVTGLSLATGFIVVEPVTAKTFTANYEGSLSGSVTSPVGSLLDLDIPTQVDFSATGSGQYRLGTQRFLDQELTLSLSSLEPTLASLETAYFDGLLAGWGLGNTSDLIAQLDTVFDYTLTGSGVLSYLTPGDADITNDPFAIRYDSDLNELIIDEFDASSCRYVVCQATSVANFGLMVNVDAFSTFVASLSELPLPADAQAKLAKVQALLTLVPFDQVTVASGMFNIDLNITPISLTDLGSPDDYAITVDKGSEVSVSVAGTNEILFQKTVTEPLAYSTYSTDYTSYSDDAASYSDSSKEDTSSYSSSKEDSYSDSSKEDKEAADQQGSTTGGNGGYTAKVPDVVVVKEEMPQSVPEPGILVGLLAAGGLAWRRRTPR
ncbi:MAG: PEP-CTERM sorting domain-containing protein [Cyanobacteria bacterium J06627_15]